ncbi:MAG: hypothetical protein ILP19_05105, partial [Oscillospiraceae bacterium]|nr:hypothetical protein [Oscillospiraceae bacterium]
MKKSYIPVIAILLAGCTNTVTDTPPDTSAVTTVPPVTSAVTDSTDMTTVTASETTQTAEDKGQSFAGRAEGRYYCNINGGLGEERLKIEINSFGGNLYAMCSLGGDTDKPPQEDGDYAYSFWTAELIPQEPGAFLTDADRCETGVLCFSDMSNAGRYWSAPDTGYVSLTDDGIVFEGIDLVFDCKDNDSLRTELLRYEDSISDVSDDTASYDELYGLWKTSDGGFVRFDNDNTMTAYRKEPGREVQFREESFRAEDGSISLYTSPDGSPEEIRYTLGADTLTLFQDDGEREYIRADESDIPL